MRPVGGLDGRGPRLRRIAGALRPLNRPPRRSGRRPPPRADAPSLDAMLRQVNGERVAPRRLRPPDEDDAPRDRRPPAGGPVADDERPGRETPGAGRFGQLGRPISRGHPLYVGFVGAIGVLGAIGLVRLLGELSGVITLLVVSAFLALGLAPVVDALTARGLRRPMAVAAVFGGVVAVVAGFVSVVVPLVVAQATALASAVPGYVVDAEAAIQQSPALSRFDAEYRVSERVSTQLEARLASGETVSMVFGGIFGAGRAVVSGVFSTLTVLVLTLYFLGSLNHIKAAGYALVPRSRRRRVQLLGDEISRRIGGYVIGQIAIATVNAVCSYVVLSLLSIPYAAVLALVVGVLGLIPLVGATLGAIVVVVVALFTSVTSAVVLAVYFLVYQQVENYLLAPRVMQRAVAVPGAVAIVAALAGGSLLGIVGALIAIPLAAGVLLVVQEVVVPRQDRS